MLLRFCILQLHKVKVIQTQLFVSGLSTLMQTLFGTRLPSVVGGSYAFVIPTTSIIQARRYQRITDPHEVSLCDMFHFGFYFTQMKNVPSVLVIFLACFVFFFSLPDFCVGILDDFSAVYTDNGRDTGCTYCYLGFPDDYGVFWLVEKCCKVLLLMY